MALQKKISFKGLSAPTAYAVIDSLYTKKVKGGYETTSYIKVYDSKEKENVLYCTEDSNADQLNAEQAYTAVKKKEGWKSWKNV